YLNKNWINFAVSFVAIAMGVIFILGLQVSPIGIYTNLILNFLPFLVIGITIYAVRKQLNQIKAVSTDVASDKLQYLKNTLSLDAEELSDLSKKVSTFNVTDIKKWIINNTSVLDRLNKKKIRDKNDWVAILNELNEENEIKEKRLEDIRKMILKKEMQIKLNSKMEAFSGKLELNTLKSVVELLKDEIDPKKAKTTDEKVSEVFDNVLKESKAKYKAEWGKFILNGAFIGSAALGGLKVIYPIAQAVLNTINTSINLTPRFRNVPTAFSEEDFDVNEDIKSDKLAPLPA
ncbi:MAG: hypothetical protein K1000chlam1_00121, partial [Candidatus Anoxychlamydiales bacterium]|nr:hypothetical protein [Candidatus Anoxychlamydiales bacterium]